MAATKKAIDFTNVKEVGNFRPKRKPEGDYRATITNVDDATSKAGNDQWVFTIVLNSDKRAIYPYYCGTDTEQAWKVRNLCIAAGLSVPKKKVAVDPNKLVGKEIAVTLEDDEYEGKPKSSVQATFPVSELAGDEPDDDTDTDAGDDDSDDNESDDLDLEEL